VAELLSVSEAAKMADIPERTFRRWVASGRIASEQDPLMVRGRVLRAEVVMQFRDALNGAGQRPASDPPPPANDRPLAEDGPPVAGQWPDNLRSHEETPELAAPCPCCQVKDRERETIIADVDFLRATVERQAEQLQRHAVAEEQLRVCLMRLEETNRELSGALIVKALPPAPVEAPKVRWWRLWR
jgi:hypothetical protein